MVFRTFLGQRAGGYAGVPGYLTKGIENGGKLDWRLAQDGMTLELPAGGTEIRVSE